MAFGEASLVKTAAGKKYIYTHGRKIMIYKKIIVCMWKVWDLVCVVYPDFVY